jgi:hypothetical protein
MFVGNMQMVKQVVELEPLIREYGEQLNNLKKFNHQAFAWMPQALALGRESEHSLK